MCVFYPYNLFFFVIINITDTEFGTKIERCLELERLKNKM